MLGLGFGAQKLRLVLCYFSHCLVVIFLHGRAVIYKFLADRIASSMTGYWHNIVVCPSGCDEVYYGSQGLCVGG